jgi:hypothetical protein
MSNLNKKNPVDALTYKFLNESVKVLDQPFGPNGESGGVLIHDLLYWNFADPQGSASKAVPLAWSINNACIQNVVPWGCTFKGDDTEHATCMHDLILVMQSPSKMVSDISKALAALFAISDPNNYIRQGL